MASDGHGKGVRQFAGTGKPGGVSGGDQPASSSNPDTTGGASGSPVGDAQMADGAASQTPSGVERGDGTETLRGTSVAHKQKSDRNFKAASVSRGDGYPEGVKRSDGTKAPKKAE